MFPCGTLKRGTNPTTTTSITSPFPFKVNLKYKHDVSVFCQGVVSVEVLFLVRGAEAMLEHRYNPIVFRISELLWRVFRGAAGCQQTAEVWRSRRLLSFTSSLPVLLGHAAALLQRHQLLHGRDGGQDRLHRPAQEGGPLEMIKTDTNSKFVFSFIKENAFNYLKTKKREL